MNSFQSTSWKSGWTKQALDAVSFFYVSTVPYQLCKRRDHMIQTGSHTALVWFLYIHYCLYAKIIFLNTRSLNLCMFVARFVNKDLAHQSQSDAVSGPTFLHKKICSMWRLSAQTEYKTNPAVLVFCSIFLPNVPISTYQVKTIFLWWSGFAPFLSNCTSAQQPRGSDCKHEINCLGLRVHRDRGGDHHSSGAMALPRSGRH